MYKEWWISDLYLTECALSRLGVNIRKLALLTHKRATESKEEFYGILKQLYNDIPKYDIKIVMGDSNANQP